MPEARPQAGVLVVVVTDGKTNAVNRWPYGSQHTIYNDSLAERKMLAEAKMLQAQGVAIHAVGVGPRALK